MSTRFWIPAFAGMSGLCLLLDSDLEDPMHLRRATVADITVLRHWDGQPHVIAASGDDDAFDWETELPRDVDWRELLIAEIDERPVGFIQIIDPVREETHYWGDCEPNLRAIDIWIGEVDCLNKGYGTKMMRLAIERCFADPAVTAILIDPLASNTRAHRFYERLGFVAVGPRRFGWDDCVVYRLERDAWQQQISEESDPKPVKANGYSLTTTQTRLRVLN